MLKKALFIIIPIIIIDQIFKIWIKTHMHIGEEIKVLGNWFIIHFIENNGMAFGMEFAGETGKVILTVFRIIAVGALGWYIKHLINKKAGFGLIASISLILTGALGNILDSVFYGVIFSESTYYNVAAFMPEGGGYSSFLHGKVVDMLYFPVIHTFYPDWVPYLGGKDFIFFRPVFNIADSAITIGVLSLILFQRNVFAKKVKPIEGEIEENQAINP
ncbi:MAG: lipoprotein signal peptidase [Bacteroidetes bacterium]|nr:lipoprotein signal peptidase [Bacteroidota bacterium]